MIREKLIDWEVEKDTDGTFWLADLVAGDDFVTMRGPYKTKADAETDAEHLKKQERGSK